MGRTQRAFAAAVAGAAALQLASAATVLPFVAYVSNKGELRASPHTFSLLKAQSIARMANAVVYSQLEFDSSFGIISRNANDTGKNYEDVVGLKQLNSDLKVLCSVGGSNLPTAAWSAMVASSTYRATFITSVQGMLDVGFDGIEINWDYPGSEARSIWMDDGAGGFTEYADGGGTSDDSANLAQMLSEMRSALGSDVVIALRLGPQADRWTGSLPSLDAYVDIYLVHAYDYFVSGDSATGGSAVTAPSQPIVDNKGSYGSVEGTLQAYLGAGVSSYKVNVVVPAYGQAYYVPDAPQNGWATFGMAATQSGKCAGPYQATYGAFTGGDGVCGQVMYSEIQRVLTNSSTYVPSPVQDNATTMSQMLLEPSSMTWISFTGPAAASSLVTTIAKYRCGGVGINSVDMDTSEDGTDFQLTSSLCRDFFGADNRCTPQDVSTTRGPVNYGDCSSRDGGTYCIEGDTTSFMFCPEGVSESCPSGLECVQSGDTWIMCDWPQ